MSRHKLDNLFKKKLHGYEAPVPANMWERISNASGGSLVGTKRDYRYLLLLLLLPIITGVLFIVGAGNEDIQRMDTAENVPDIIAYNTVDKNSLTEDVQIATYQTIHVKSDQLGEDNTGGELINGAGAIVGNLSQSIDFNTNLQEFKKKGSLIQQTESDNINYEIPAQNLSDIENMIQSNNQINALVESGGSVHTDNVGYEKHRTLSSISAASRLIDLPASLISRHTIFGYNNTTALPVEAVNRIESDCFSFGKSAIDQFYADIYAGPIYPVKNVSSKSENVDDYISERENTESTKFSFSAGARLTYLLNNNFTIGSGIHYTQINERFDYFNENEIRIQTVITIDTINIGGVITVVSDTTTETITGTRIKKTYNRFHMIDIPLLVGYDFEFGDWGFSGKVGPMVNLLFRKKGDILSPQLTPVSFSSSDQNAFPAYRDKLGISVFGSFGVTRRIGHKTYLLVEPHILYRIDPVSHESYSIEQTSTQIGLMLGIRYKF